MIYKQIALEETFLAIQRHYLSCGKDYDQEVYGGYVGKLNDRLSCIDPTVIVKISGWRSQTGIFNPATVSEITLYNYQSTVLDELVAAVRQTYKRWNALHVCQVLDEGVPLAILSFDDLASKTMPVPRWAEYADVQHIVHHNQALDVICEYMQTHSAQEAPAFVHVDTHSDFFINPTELPGSIGTYVNDLMRLESRPGSYFFDKHFYWIVPDHEKANYNPCDFTPGFSCYGLEEKIPYQRTLFVDGTGVIYTQAAAGRREIVLHVCGMKDLPALKDKQVVLDIDLDFFSCKGRFNPSRGQLIDMVNQFNAEIQQRLTPACVIVCQSPDYTPIEDNTFLVKCFSEMSARRHVFPDSTSLKHTGLFDADLFYMHYLNERRALLEIPAFREYMAYVLQERQLYTVAQVCRDSFQVPDIFHMQIHTIMSGMLSQAIGLTGLHEDLVENIRTKYGRISP